GTSKRDGWERVGKSSRLVWRVTGVWSGTGVVCRFGRERIDSSSTTRGPGGGRHDVAGRRQRLRSEPPPGHQLETTVPPGPVGADTAPLRGLPDPPPLLRGEEIVANLDGEGQQGAFDVLHPGDRATRPLRGHHVLDALLNTGRLVAAEADVILNHKNALNQGGHQPLAEPL